jgi:hypothetical protein
MVESVDNGPRPLTLSYFHIELLQESPQAARVKVMASGNSIERRFRLVYYICLSL